MIMAAGITDIYGYKRNPKPQGVFSTEESLLTFGGGAAGDTQLVGYMVQNWTVTYQQNVQELFELGSSALYWVKGRPQGQGGLGRVVGEQSADSPANLKLFPAAAYDLCNGGVLMRINAKSGACGNTGGGSYAVNSKAAEVSLSMDGCVVTSVGFQVTVDTTLINETIAFRFAALDVK
jgi:hypothetical protein